MTRRLLLDAGFSFGALSLGADPNTNALESIIDTQLFETDKPDLFAKPRVDLGLDVISKAPLDRNAPEVAMALRICTRCRDLVEKKQLNAGPMSGTSARWRSWLRRWEDRCVCGGYWALYTGL